MVPPEVIGDPVLDSLPVFPLPRTALLPGTDLPLHVFEARYRRLVEHCLRTHRALAVALLKPGYEEGYFQRPDIHSVMGAGVIIQEESLGDGRWNVLVRGTDRVRVVQELPSVEPYRVVRAERLPDARTGGIGVARNEQTLRTLLIRLAKAVPRARAPLHRLLQIAGSPGELADVVAAQLLGNPASVQRVLEELDVERRLHYVNSCVVELCLRFDPGWVDRDGPLN